MRCQCSTLIRKYSNCLFTVNCVCLQSRVYCVSRKSSEQQYPEKLKLPDEVKRISTQRSIFCPPDTIRTTLTCLWGIQWIGLWNRAELAVRPAEKFRIWKCVIRSTLGSVDSTVGENSQGRKSRTLAPVQEIRSRGVF